MKPKVLKELLDHAYQSYAVSDFIAHDPIVIPHAYSLKQDIEIMGFFAAILAWGQRKTIINKCKELGELMGDHPYDFLMDFSTKDEKFLQAFVHRTFNGQDLCGILKVLKGVYKEFESLEMAFFPQEDFAENAVENGLIRFRKRFEESGIARRTLKHIASPEKKSACKRLNMFLRWMVRKDAVDMGLWKHIAPSQLICPLDVHVLRIAQELKLLSNNKSDWQAAIQLSAKLKTLCPEDPVKYDLALFGLGVSKVVIS